ncbi:MAG: HEPN domain-containing protein [Actinomycetales bacterium]|nr:HEPN domain-containing protein [Actinomycetales bacterium]
MSDTFHSESDPRPGHRQNSPAARPEPSASLPVGSWPVGREELNALLRAGRLRRVQADRSEAARELRMAEEHLDSAQEQLTTRPRVAFLAAYDAARLALSALLVNQGLRVESGEGGHQLLGDVAVAQLGRSTYGRFDAMRRMRNASAYPNPDREVADDADAVSGLAAAQAIVADVYGKVEVMHVFTG